MHCVFMGVSGSGKSTVARRVAERLGADYAEADRFHPQANIAKMSDGVPLEDADRRPWLLDLAAWIHRHDVRGRSTVMACSALKRSYRDLLRTGAADVRFAHLAGNVDLIAGRLRERSGHFMPPGLLESQYAALEPLEVDEDGFELDVTADAGALVEEAVRRLGGDTDAAR